ncbi:MAG: hypothetical protein GIX03_07390 [Candidatus Eremiobacteraeota bacterium]|nr:hypothetical protein [Candidatus Eremiobacteraeota bacterium]MBC5802814.1 hypothetical protein [Candidatus Eremiobacteraeota bacterium]MBC5821116.1 hypothetical protein [Candidatus Eremiobacteraeota bacterium]
MKGSSRIATAAITAALATSLCAPQPAAADGAASTRNIIFGAAAIGGTLLILNHNKKVHQKYAEYDRRQAEDEAAKNQAEAAYQSERQAYNHEVAVVDQYRQETAYQHSQVVARDREIASLEHSLAVAKYGRQAVSRVAYAAPRKNTGRHLQRHTRRIARVQRRSVNHNRPPTRMVAARQQKPQVVSYGWGAY